MSQWWAAGNARQPQGQSRELANRLDRRLLGTSRAGTGPAPQSGEFIGNLVIVHGTGPTSGVFIYNGAPKLGNPPQIAMVPTGVTADPYGNAITASKILMQGNVITESGGIFRTAAAAPLIQLDGPHDALLIYNAAAALIATIAPAAGNDGLGNNFRAGIGTYTATQVANLFSGGLAMALLGATPTVNDATMQPALDGSGVALGLSSGTISTDAASSLFLGDSAATHAGLVVVDGRDGSTYGTERAVRTATGQTVNSLTPATIAGIGVTIPVAAAKYLVRGCIIILQGAGGAGHQGVRFTGPAISNMNVSFLSVEGATIFNSGVLGALSTDMDSGAIPINTTAELHFDGIITFSAAGSTFGMQADCITSATDTWTLSANSYLELLPL